MKKTMKIIDLLNLVYKGKAPKKVIYNGITYIFQKDVNDYYNGDTYLFEY